MNATCSACGLNFHREPGYYLGSIYINYGLTACLVTAGYILARFVWNWPDRWVMSGLVVFCVVFPLWFVRFARSIWLAFDQLWDPQPERAEHKRPTT